MTTPPGSWAWARAACRMRVNEWSGVLPGEKQGTYNLYGFVYKQPAQKILDVVIPCVSVSGMLIVQRRPVILWANSVLEIWKSLPRGKFSWVTQSSNFANQLITVFQREIKLREKNCNKNSNFLGYLTKQQAQNGAPYHHPRLNYSFGSPRIEILSHQELPDQHN